MFCEPAPTARLSRYPRSCSVCDDNALGDLGARDGQLLPERNSHQNKIMQIAISRTARLRVRCPLEPANRDPQNTNCIVQIAECRSGRRVPQARRATIAEKVDFQRAFRPGGMVSNVGWRLSPPVASMGSLINVAPTASSQSVINSRSKPGF